MTQSKTAQAQKYIEMAKQAHDDVLEYLIGSFPDRVAVDAFRIHAEAGPEGAKVITEFNRHYPDKSNGTSPQSTPQTQPAPQPVTIGHTIETIKAALSDIKDNNKLEVTQNADGLYEVRKTEKLAQGAWSQANKRLKDMGFKWVTYNEDNPDKTGLWRSRP